MGDDLEGCECVWSHELAMRRLLSWIRQSQTSCTDSECVDALPQPGNNNNNNNNVGGDFTMMTVFAIMAVMLYLFRPTATRQRNNPVQKKNPDNDGNDPNNGHPPPAVY